MDGAIAEAEPEVREAVFDAYLARFPGTQDLLGGQGGVADLEELLRARLYAFAPQRVLYMNNRIGLGDRREISLGGPAD